MFKKKLFILILFMGLVSFQFKLYSQTIQTFATPGVTSWTCPVGVTSVTVECWGAGGGGGGGGAVFNAAGGGGGGGAYASSVITVASGNIYTITVGAGGAGGGSFGTTGGNGSNSSFNSTIVMAAGGNGGIGSGGGATGGIGGAATSCTGTVKYSGGNGGSGTTSGGGGGGSSAGSSINGNNAIQYIGGVAPAGGVAGTSASTLAAGAVGNVGLSGGGGASGGRRGSSATDNAGGAGGAGKVVLSYCTAMSITSTQTNVSCTGGNDGIIDLTVTGGIQNNNNIILDVQTVDDICSTGDIDSWQSFTPTFTARLAAFEVKLDGPDNGNWYLYKGTGVGGVLLASGTYAAAAAGYKYISIPSLPQLTAGQICTFRLINFSADWLVTCSPNNYSGGQDNNNNADDRVFKTHMVLNPYSYLWSNGALTEDVSNLLAGAYTVTVTDAVGCSAVDTKTITSLGPLAITASASPTTICAGSTSTLTAFGPLTLDQYSIPGSQTGSWAGTNAEQQTFIPSMTGLLRKIRIQTYAPFAGTSVTINIKSGTPTTGTLLTSVTYFKGGPINSWDDIILPGSGINVVSGTTYYIEIVSGSQVDWIYNLTNTYANGNASRGGTNFGWDYNFETYMDLNTYVWNPGALSNPEIIVSPTITTNHTVTVSNTLGCSNSQMVTVNVDPVSVGGTASANQSICIGQVPSPITLTGFTGAIQWQSSPDNSNWINITGATTNALTSAQMGALSATTYYRANVTSGLCTAALSNTIVITVNPFPNIIASSSSTAICVGFTASLTATGAVNYTWNPGSLTGTLTSGVSNLNVSPSVTTVYTVTGTSATGCTNTQTVSLTVNNNPTVTATSSPTAICVGASANLTAAGASTYTWNPGPLTGSLVSVSPNATTIYTLTGASSEGCVKTETVSLTVNNNPTLTTATSPTAICVGTSANLTASGASTYTWNPGPFIGSLVSVSPIVTTIFTVTGTSIAGCVKTETINLIVNSNPTVTATSSPTAICIGSSANLTASGASSYTWNPSALTGSLVSVSPTTTTIYTVTGTNAAGCVKTETVNIVVNSLPSILTNVNTNTVCLGGLVTFSNLGANSFTFNPTNTTGSIVSIPINTVGVTVFTITGQDSQGCINSTTTSITAFSLPVVSSSPPSAILCSGQSISLFGTGANTYTWSNGISNGISFTPTISLNYVVNGVDLNGCTNTQTVSVIVNNNPTLTATSSPTAICVGASANLTASGASSYTWSPSSLTGSLVSVNPTVTTIYTVTGTSAGGCVKTETISLIVNSNPTVTATSSPTAICVGTSANLTASGASTYAWSPSSLTGSLVSVSPTVTTIYTVTGTSAGGCVKTQTVNLTVNPNLPLSTSISSSSTTICSGTSVNFLSTEINSGTSPTYQWQLNGSNIAGATFPTFSSNTLNDYDVISLIMTANEFCTTNSPAYSNSITLTVNPNPILSVTASSTTICEGSVSTLSASGANTYTWTPGLISGSIITVTPTINTTYLVEGENVLGCFTTDSISIIVNSLPIANAVLPSSDTICYDGAVAVGLNSQAGITSFSWTSSYGVSNNAQFPTFTNVTSVGNVYFYGSVEDGNGCISLYDTVLVVVTPSITLSALPTNVSCFGLTDGLIDLSVTGGLAPYSYSWSNSALTEDLSLLSSGNYSVTVNDASTCTTSLSVIITEPTSLVANSVESSFIGCNGGNGILTVTATGGTGTYIGTGSYTVVAGNYTYTVTDANGCSSTTTINVNEPTQIVATANITSPIACNGGNALLTVSAIGGAGSYAGTGTYTVAAGNYTYTVTDANGCSSTTTISVTEPTPIVANVSITSPITCNGGNAFLTVSATGGAGTYIGIGTYTVAAGNYTYTVTDANGCSSTTTISVTEPAVIVANVNITAPIACNGGNAILTVSATGGTGAYTGAGTFTLAAGNYTYTVTDANGCSNNATITVTQPSPVLLIASATNSIICIGQNTILNGTSVNTYTWSPGLLLGASVTVTPNASTTYTVNGTNGAGCLGTQTISIIVNSLPVVNAGANQTICNSQSVTLTGSGSATSYTWNNGAINGTAFTPTISNSYIVTGTDLNNCSNTDTMDVTVNSILTLTLSASTSSICSGATATLTANGASTYTWNPGLLSGSNPSVNPNSTTTYTVVGDNGIGCVGTETISLIVQQLPNIIANATSTTICVGQSVTLNGAGAANYSWSNGVFDGIAFTPTTTNLYTITGTNAFGCSSTNTIIVNVNNGTSATPNTNPSVICFGDTVQLSVIGGSIPTWSLNSNPSVLTISPMSNISYTYSAIDTLGCVGDITFYVNINQDCDIIVYNGFTPNGDGLNDFWIIDNIEKFPNNKVYIFNRWGNKIFQTTEYNNTNNLWDGKLNGQLVPSGTYFYVIESELLIKKGWIEITN